jgi:hypothetical protein
MHRRSIHSRSRGSTTRDRKIGTGKTRSEIVTRNAERSASFKEQEEIRRREFSMEQACMVLETTADSNDVEKMADAIYRYLYVRKGGRTY